MKQKSKQKNNDFVSSNNKKIIALAIALVLLIGGTYAWLQVVLTGTKTTRIESGNLAVEIKNEENAITIDKAVPISVNEGKTQANPYEFKLENTGNVQSVYTIFLDDVEIDTTKEFNMPKNLVRYYLTKQVKKDDGTAVGNLSEETGTLAEATNEGKVVLDTSTDSTALNSDEYIEYTLRLWISDSATTADLQQTVTENSEPVKKVAAYAGKIRIEATQTGIEEDAAYQ